MKPQIGLNICMFCALSVFCLKINIRGETTTGNEMITYVWSEGNGRVAVRLEPPSVTRYPGGAPVVVEASTCFVDQFEFHRRNDTRKIGAVTYGRDEKTIT